MNTSIPLPSEHGEQAAFFATILLRYRNDDRFLRPLLFAVPNGAFLGGKSAVTMEKLRAEGLTPGVADILYLQPRGGYSFLALEMKRADKRNKKSGGLRPEQVEFLNAAARAGAFFSVCYSAEEAERAFDEYMGLEDGNGIINQMDYDPNIWRS